MLLVFLLHVSLYQTVSGGHYIMNLESTYVVLDENADATPVEVTPTVFEDLDKQFENFVGKLLISQFSFD